ncbi:hypothetical protein BABA_07501 [Neobacillus bataviensis LMG 21833]|uniref:Lipoprotein n=1 Tax=Neobacillus bataviensis LMG 21833 TaxID=1117379 RepID=K6E9C2_9BACI|nr:hypothetical protein [Neobacillus bataviensis]EKN69941.1 hypothetical protein BABA_07501 [Neobacillus bataviensis LMG 21833]
MKNKLLVLAILSLFSIIFAGCSGDNEKTAANQEKHSVEKATKSEKPEDNSSATTEAEKVDTTAAESKITEQTFEKITFNMPESYQQLEIGDQGMPAVVYMIDANVGNSFNIVAEKLPDGMSLDQYIQAATAQTGFDYISNQNYTEGELNWNEAVSINPKSMQKMSQRTFILDGAAYVFTYAAVPDAFDKKYAEFVDLTKSVKVN